MKKYENPPEFLIIHVGGNDLGDAKVGFLRNNLKNTLCWLRAELPNTHLVWSQILPRIKWRYSDNDSAMQASRRRINSTIAEFVTREGGYYIRYPDILANNNFIDKDDGVHLTPLGNQIFLNILQGAIEHFVCVNLPGLTFPVQENIPEAKPRRRKRNKNRNFRK